MTPLCKHMQLPSRQKWHYEKNTKQVILLCIHPKILTQDLTILRPEQSVQHNFRNEASKYWASNDFQSSTSGVPSDGNDIFSADYSTETGLSKKHQLRPTNTNRTAVFPKRLSQENGFLYFHLLHRMKEHIFSTSKNSTENLEHQKTNMNTFCNRGAARSGCWSHTCWFLDAWWSEDGWASSRLCLEIFRSNGTEWKQMVLFYQIGDRNSFCSAKWRFWFYKKMGLQEYWQKRKNSDPILFNATYESNNTPFQCMHPEKA